MADVITRVTTSSGSVTVYRSGERFHFITLEVSCGDKRARINLDDDEVEAVISALRG